MYFRHFVIISPWKRARPFIWINLNPLHPRILCAKFVEISPMVLGKKTFKFCWCIFAFLFLSSLAKLGLQRCAKEYNCTFKMHLVHLVLQYISVKLIKLYFNRYFALPSSCPKFLPEILLQKEQILKIFAIMTFNWVTCIKLNKWVRSTCKIRKYHV